MATQQSPRAIDLADASSVLSGASGGVDARSPAPQTVNYNAGTWGTGGVTGSPPWALLALAVAVAYVLTSR